MKTQHIAGRLIDAVVAIAVDGGVHGVLNQRWG